MLHEVAPVILTRNEAPNLARTLAPLAWAKEILVLDSGSTDDTESIARAHPNVRWLTRPFDSHAQQWNYAVAQARADLPWVLALDADYVVSEALVEQVAHLRPHPATAGFRARFRYCLDGKALRGSLYPPHVVLFRCDRGGYEQVGHTQRLVLEGAVEDLDGWIDHDDRKPYTHWIESQRRYARLEAQWLRRQRWSTMRWSDRARRVGVICPWAVPLYCLFAKGAVLDGRRGLAYAKQRAIAESLIARAMFETSHAPIGASGES